MNRVANVAIHLYRSTSSRTSICAINYPINIKCVSNRHLSQSQSTREKLFRTDESDPTKHNDIHHGLFYRIPNEIASRLFILGGFDKEQQLMLKTFRETSIMVRKPALEIINYLRMTDFSRPPNRFVLCKLLLSTLFIFVVSYMIYQCVFGLQTVELELERRLR